jgi:DMSO/TMAO reductase YedYZ molybdopterin-dependent catalytic subunit
MSVFVVRHQHPAEHCPAADFTAGAGLLNHLSRPSAARHGVRIRAEAVLTAHTLMMIVEADREDALRAFLRPLKAAGTLEVDQASTCAMVVAAGGCASTMPAADQEVPSLDPEEACLAAIDAGLLVRRAHPLNCETPLSALTGGLVMPNVKFYVRNHFGIPDLDPAGWRRHVGGLVERHLSLGLAQLRAMRSASAAVTLECAGNGRAGLKPPTPGEQWGTGAVSTAEWTGVPLTEVLDRAGVQATAREALFRGADRGQVDGHGGRVHFERSLPVGLLGQAGALLAYAMNGEELPAWHGYPLRLVVPGWYAVASVKWLTEIELIAQPFRGHFQVDRYHISGEPLSLQRVRSLIIEPAPGVTAEPGDITIRGVAWSGAAPIVQVEVSIDGTPWQSATLVGEPRRHSWQWWELPAHLADPVGISIRARATDRAGQTQPDMPHWNPLGYANNAIHQVHLAAAAGTWCERPRYLEAPQS